MFYRPNIFHAKIELGILHLYNIYIFYTVAGFQVKVVRQSCTVMFQK